MLSPNAPPGRRAPALGGLGALLACAGLVLGCGISLDTGETSTETFRSLTVEGDFHVGGTLSLTLEYAQPYDVQVEIFCELDAKDIEATNTPLPAVTATPTPVTVPKQPRLFKNRVLGEIVHDVLPPNPAGGPADEATPSPGRRQADFPAPAIPGRYIVRCYTPKDTNNLIAKEITIRPAPAPG